MSLNYYSGNKKLEEQLGQIKEILNCKGVFYSFYYTPDQINPRSVQFMVLDIKNRRLYLINSKL